MVYNTKTLENLHGLTDKGMREYEKMLESAADELLFKAQHPVKWFVQKVRDLFE